MWDFNSCLVDWFHIDYANIINTKTVLIKKKKKAATLYIHWDKQLVTMYSNVAQTKNVKKKKKT